MVLWSDTVRHVVMKLRRRDVARTTKIENCPIQFADTTLGVLP